MDDPQNLAKIKDGTLVPTPYTMLTEVQRAYVDYKALGGIVTDDEGVRKMTVSDLATMLGVTRNAIYDAKDHVPNFWQLVEDRRKELGGQSRLARFHETWYLKAIKMDNWQISEAWARNFDKSYREPKQKVEHELGNSWSALLENKRKQANNIVEGEVVDDKTT